MIPVPKCQISHKQSYKVCLQKDCFESPFICDKCQMQYCINLHNNHEIIEWSQIAGLLSQNYPRINECINQLGTEMSLNNKSIIQYLRNQQYQLIDGVSMRDLYYYLMSISPNKQIKQQTTIKQAFYIKQDQSDFESCFNKGLDKFNSKQYEEAEEYFERAISIKKNDSNSYNYYIKIVKALNRESEYITKYTKLISVDQKNSILYFKRGRLYKQQKRYKSALLDYDNAIQIDQSYYLAYNARGILYGELNIKGKEFQDFAKAIELNPKFDLAYYNRARIYFAKGELQKSLEDYNRVIELNPKLFQAYHNRSLIYHQKIELSKALEDCNKAIELTTQYSKLYYRRGLVYFDLNDYTLAIENFLKCNQLAPDCMQSYYYIGRIHLNNRNLQTALFCFDKLIEAIPKSQFYLYRGIIYSCLQKQNQADDNYFLALNSRNDSLNSLKMLYKDLKKYRE